MKALRVPAATALAVAAALALASCGTSQAPPPGEPSASGTVTALDVMGSAAHFTLSTGVEGDYFWNAAISVEKTKLHAADGTLLPPTDLRNGDIVEVWTSTCAESYPVQCPADYVAVRD